MNHRNRISQFILLTMMPAAFGIIGCAGQPAPATAPTPDVRVVSINEAMDNSLVRAIPLNVAIPADFKYFANEPYFGNHLWTTQRNYDSLQKTGSTVRSEGLIQVRISTDIGYDRQSRSFICGPECDENVIAGRVAAQTGMRIVENERRDVHGVPVWALHFASGASPGNDAYVVYIGTLIETNAIVFTWGPPQGNSGEELWAAIKQAMFTTPPDPSFEALESMPFGGEPPARNTPPITMMTRLPASTERVASLVRAARLAGTEAGFVVDESRSREGIVRINWETDKGSVTVSMRFLDFGDEILMASNAHASGDAASELQEAESAFYATFARQVDLELPLVIMEDMVEILTVLPPR